MLTFVVRLGVERQAQQAGIFHAWGRIVPSLGIDAEVGGLKQPVPLRLLNDLDEELHLFCGFGAEQTNEPLLWGMWNGLINMAPAQVVDAMLRQSAQALIKAM